MEMSAFSTAGSVGNGSSFISGSEAAEVFTARAGFRAGFVARTLRVVASGFVFGFFFCAKLVPAETVAIKQMARTPASENEPAGWAIDCIWRRIITEHDLATVIIVREKIRPGIYLFKSWILAPVKEKVSLRMLIGH
jgi:hypothetical protein